MNGCQLIATGHDVGSKKSTSWFVSILWPLATGVWHNGIAPCPVRTSKVVLISRRQFHCLLSASFYIVMATLFCQKGLYTLCRITQLGSAAFRRHHLSFQYLSQWEVMFISTFVCHSHFLLATSRKTTDRIFIHFFYQKCICGQRRTE